MKTAKEKVSYCIGLETAKNLKHQFSDIDDNRLKEGFHDALEGLQPKLSQDEIKNVMMALRRQIETQQKEFITKVSKHNKEAGEAFLQQNKEKSGITVLPSGLQYKVIQEGNGVMPTLTDVVTVQYKGKFIDGKVFENSYDNEKPPTLPVARTIPGWAEALQLMKVGDKWEIFVPSYLAYGEAGFSPVIPPNTTLVFEMELLGVNGQ